MSSINSIKGDYTVLSVRLGFRVYGKLDFRWLRDDLYA